MQIHFDAVLTILGWNLRSWGLRLPNQTIKVYVAAITAYHSTVNGISVGSYKQIIIFIKRDKAPPPIIVLKEADMCWSFIRKIYRILCIILTRNGCP